MMGCSPARFGFLTCIAKNDSKKSSPVADGSSPTILWFLSFHLKRGPAKTSKAVGEGAA
jgi:hypothetical protein